MAKENWLAAWDWVHIHHIHPPPTVKVLAVKVLKQDSVLLEAGCVCLRQDSPGRVMWFCWMASPTSFAHCRIDSGSQSSRLQQSVRHKSYTNSPMPGEGRVETNQWPQEGSHTVTLALLCGTPTEDLVGLSGGSIRKSTQRHPRHPKGTQKAPKPPPQELRKCTPWGAKPPQGHPQTPKDAPRPPQGFKLT